MIVKKPSFAIFIAALIVACVLVFILSIFVGSVYINIFDITKVERGIILDYRLPRSLEALFVGASLGLSGSILQLILRNPLADGFTTGVASSAALGAVLAISIGLSSVFIPISAIIFGLIGIFTTISMTKNSQDYSTLILAGIVLNIVATSIIGFLKYFFEESVGGIVFWLMGGFFNVSYQKVFVVCFVFFLALYFFLRFSVQLNIFSFDNITSSAMGINVVFIKNFSYLVSAILVALSVSVSGIIPFVGLIVPHISRAIVGYEIKRVAVTASILGGMIVLLSDILSRIIIPSSEELPIGILTSVIGGAFFFYLLLKKRNAMWYG